MKRNLLMILLVMCLFFAGCSKTDPMETRSPDIEPTAVYDWMAGESPVPVTRIGRYRYGATEGYHTVSGKGTYFMEDAKAQDGHTCYILYADHGSDSLVKLCGRADCTHDNPDCNAYIFKGGCISYYNGFLYALAGEADDTFCELVKMEPDGSDHMTEIDLLAFAQEQDGDYIAQAAIDDGILFFDLLYWEVTVVGQEVRRHGIQMGTYYYKLDGSMEAPEKMVSGVRLYSCGDVFLIDTGEVQQGGEHGNRCAWDADTNTASYLIDAVGCPGYFDEDEGYFFREGCIWRKTYADNRETVMVDTGLEGDCVLYAYPDCLLVVSRDSEKIDPNLYIYNWAFELIDTVYIDYSFSCQTKDLILAETAERFFLTDEFRGSPKYYINKSELGTGNVEIHEFKYA